MAQAWHSHATSGRCVVCGRNAREARRAGTVLQGHHVVRQELLKRKAATMRIEPWRLLWDERNGVAACEQPCHAEHTSAKRRISRAKLPPQAIQFAKQYGFLGTIEREYAE